MDILLHLITAACYAGLGVFLWRALKAGPPAEGARPLPHLAQLACLLPIGLHGWLLFQQFVSESGLRLGFGVAVSLILWLAVVVYGLQSLRRRVYALQALALPLAAVGVLVPLVFPATHLVQTHAPMLAAHLLVAMLAYALATLAALHALLMDSVERRLHQHRFSRLLDSVPPLLAMESLLFRLIGVSFALLTLTVGSGVLFSEAVFGRALQFDHKTIFAIASWVIFGVLLAGRIRWGWRGRTALRWTLAGFVMLLLAYLGTRFVLEVILGRGGPLA